MTERNVFEHVVDTFDFVDALVECSDAIRWDKFLENVAEKAADRSCKGGVFSRFEDFMEREGYQDQLVEVLREAMKAFTNKCIDDWHSGFDHLLEGGLEMTDLKAVRDDVVASHEGNEVLRARAEKFFDMLVSSGAVYSPTLGMVVEYNEWSNGERSVDVIPLDSDTLADHIEYLALTYGADESWTTDLLADYEHSSMVFGEESGNDAMPVLWAVSTASDWTENPGE